MTFVEIYAAPDNFEARRCLFFWDNSDADCLLDNLIGYDENQTDPIIDEKDLSGTLEQVDDDYYFCYNDCGNATFQLLRRIN